MAQRFKIGFILLALTAGSVMGQGLSRSRGLGFRGGLWKANQGGGGFSTTDGLNEVLIDDVGGGGDMHFFSRLSGQWFLEMAIGGVGMSAMVSESTREVLESESMALFSMGGRYDFLPGKFGSTTAPYLSFGLGWYWGFSTEVSATGLKNSVKIGGDLNTGYYAGVGLNIALTSWFYFNLDFKAHMVDFTDDHPLSGASMGMGFGFMWGQKKDLFRVEEIKVIVPDIYPAYLPFYKSYPIALVTVHSTVGFPIEINLIASIKDFTDRPSESGFVRIGPGERKDIPVKAIFGNRLSALQDRQQAVLDLEIEARAGVTHRRSISAPLTVHHRNSWDGEIERLPFFVTPEATELLALVRAAADSVSSGELRSVAVARRLVASIQKEKLRYRSDPNVPFYQDDRVQFAQETLDLGGGDCDDLSVLLASLLEGAGIRTAFVDVVDPEKATAHVYVMMDTGLEAAEMPRLTQNEKRVVVRNDAQGRRRVWLPLECTLLPKGFDAAWEKGAMNYLEDAVLRGGLTAGWVRLIDVK